MIIVTKGLVWLVTRKIIASLAFGDLLSLAENRGTLSLLKISMI